MALDWPYWPWNWPLNLPYLNENDLTNLSLTLLTLLTLYRFWHWTLLVDTWWPLVTLVILRPVLQSCNIYILVYSYSTVKLCTIYCNVLVIPPQASVYFTITKKLNLFCTFLLLKSVESWINNWIKCSIYYILWL